MSIAPVKACVAFGANLGDPVATVKQALRDVANLPDTQLFKVSSLYRSAPYEAQGPDFINAVALVETQLSPMALLHALQALEQQSGRERSFRNAPRTLDLDLIFYGDVALATSELTLPHPRWHERAFVLQPLAEIWPARVSAAQLAGVQDQVIQRMV
jgi:2-amino-4-hydroxy-6-hydroxymethyldihydropteridine diphosphokinase